MRAQQFLHFLVVRPDAKNTDCCAGLGCCAGILDWEGTLSEILFLWGSSCFQGLWVESACVVL